MEKEIWKVFKETYSRTWGHITWEVSDQGRVKKNGVLYECRLNRGCKVFGPGWKLHRAVAELFIPNPDNKPYVDHINTNPLDNRTVNLKWVTPKENNNNPLTIQHFSESQKIIQNKSETRRKKSESMKIYWQNKKLNK